MARKTRDKLQRTGMDHGRDCNYWNFIDYIWPNSRSFFWICCSAIQLSLIIILSSTAHFLNLPGSGRLALTLLLSHCLSVNQIGSTRHYCSSVRFLLLNWFVFCESDSRKRLFFYGNLSMYFYIFSCLEIVVVWRVFSYR